MPSDSLNNNVCGFGYDLEELSENSILKMRKQIQEVKQCGGHFNGAKQHFFFNLQRGSILGVALVWSSV